ncbi:MAG: hypothetical protein ACE5J9_09015 [Methanosarcinales archaeon]
MIPKTLKIKEDYKECIERIAYEEHLEEDAVIEKFLSEGIEKYRINKAINKYVEKEIDLNGAAQIAGVSVSRFMNELEKRGYSLTLDSKMYEYGLEVLRKHLK